jgi:sulfane dehydrogenase subunit SoxC
MVMPNRPVLDPSSGFRRIPLLPHQLSEPITPTPDVFVLAHLGVPRVDISTWRLEIDGLVREPRSYTFDDLRRLPRTDLQAFHKCVGNPLAPAVATRRVANVTWGGLDLKSLLENAGMDPEARFLWSYGLDYGDFEGTYNDSYVKDLPRERLDAGDVLLAYELNGQPLPAEHGFPLRLVVPGFYGTNSVKWLYRMTLAGRRAESLFTTRLYNDSAQATEAATTVPPSPAWAVEPESVIVAPSPEEQLALGAPYEVWGWAWAPTGVGIVDVSFDGAASWEQAKVEPRHQLSWQRFSVRWRPSLDGSVTLACRATDVDGVTQPLTGARNEVYRVRVEVTT